MLPRRVMCPIRSIRPACADLILGVLVTAMLAVPLGAQQMSDTRYYRAERLLSWNLDALIAGDQVSPHWMRGASRFWYRNKTGSGAQFIQVDAARNTRGLLFDEVRLAGAMSLAADTSFEPAKLPFTSFEFADDTETAIEFNATGKGFHCNIGSYVCTVGDSIPNRTAFVPSPDRQWEAFIHEYNLWIRPFEREGDSIQLTTDGERYFAYGITEPRPGQIIAKTPQRPVLQWSPDSRKIAVQRMDERNVGLLPLYSSTHQRPEF